jgi:phage shock protein A
MNIPVWLAQRVRWLANARASGTADEAELSRHRQREALRRLRRDLIELSVARHRLEEQVERLRRRAGRAEELARQSIAAGQETQARFQLARKRAVTRQLELLGPQLEQILADERRLFRQERVLGLRMEAYRQRRRALGVRQASSGARLRLAAARAQPEPTALASAWRTVETGKSRRSA